MITPLACYLTTNDHAILQEILDQDLRDNAYSRLLRSKLLQAAICPPFRVPDDAVTIGSSVTFCVNGGAARTAYVVQNESRDFPVYTVSVKSILGLGMIGMRAGRTINIETDIGLPQRIDVLRLDFQAPAPRFRLVNAVTSAVPRRAAAAR
ncbi:hypothetical protein [Rhizobium leguminosarum]|uniref:hypothetical protein n=1 Tax=Rhizobium leguminosarum TaxID=384 RepID=UPI001C94C427|nr:hypothetical protein [Rhizobium leguminosarum]MBY5466402.1 hypothetical protein [Rhizobium leguminosarum]MBY5529393.1 hypothetical protein [Rhizobium leguminosarum]